jgi:hypothetical protein
VNVAITSSACTTASLFLPFHALRNILDAVRYVQLYQEPGSEKPLFVRPNKRWQVAVGVASDEGFSQVR